VIAIAVAMALALACSVEWLLRGLERMVAVATANAIGGAVVLAGTIVIVEAKPEPELALGVFVAGEAAVAVLCLRYAWLGRLPRPRLSGLRMRVRRSWPLGASALVVYSYYANLDTIILSVTRSAEEAGLYSAPYRLFLALNILGTFAAYALMPRIARAVEAGRDEDAAAMAGLRRALVPLAGYGLVVLGLVEVVGDDVLRALFGPAFAGQGVVFLVLCLTVPWYSIGFPVGYALVARSANHRFFLGAGVAGVLNIVLNVSLIPPFGPIGAAAATAVALIMGSAVWLQAHGMINARTAPLLTAVTLASLAGLLVALTDEAASPIGLLTLCFGLGALCVGAMDARAGRWAR